MQRTGSRRRISLPEGKDLSTKNDAPRDTPAESPANVAFRLLVLRSPRLEMLREFFERLGVAFIKEQHGAGPRHYAGNVGGVVLELYRLATDAPPPDLPMRLGFSVADLAAALLALEEMGMELISKPKETPWGLRAVVRDPDGRTMELYQA